MRTRIEERAPVGTAAAAEAAAVAAIREAGTTPETVISRSTTVPGRMWGGGPVDARCPALGHSDGGRPPGAEAAVVHRPAVAVEVPPDPVEGPIVPPQRALRTEAVPDRQ